MLGKEVEVIGNINGHQSGKIFSANGIAPTIMAHTHGYALGGVLIEENKVHRKHLQRQ